MLAMVRTHDRQARDRWKGGFNLAFFWGRAAFFFGPRRRFEQNNPGSNHLHQNRPRWEARMSSSRFWAAFDVGWSHLAYVIAELQGCHFVHLVEARLVDLRELRHCVVSQSECTLQHTADCVDRMAHFFQEHDQYFVDVELVLIERQPPCGLTNVEQLLYQHFRTKAKLIAPRAMHTWMNIQHLSYEQRKRATEKRARPLLQHFSVWHSPRKHDVADATCLLLYALRLEEERHREGQALMEKKKRLASFVVFDEENMTLDQFFTKYRFPRSVAATRNE